MGKEIKISGMQDIIPVSDHPEGTVYRGKRTKEVESVIKILRHPFDLTNKEDQNTAIFLKEVKKLKHLNHVPNIHVVKIINAGLTDTDSFPFIESELITGTDLEELLNFPHNAIFSIEQAIELTNQMAIAIAHCHTAMLKHGRINSYNIRLNSETGSYTLINFGRILLTDEQRKAEVKNTKAAEYLAPEQWEGQILFETDIYSLGVVLFQVLCGSFPQRKGIHPNASEDDGSKPYPSISQQVKQNRKENLPLGWIDKEKEQQMLIPEWLLKILSICLHEEPSKRYGNGIKLQEAVKASQEQAKTVALKDVSITTGSVAARQQMGDQPNAAVAVTPKNDDEKDAEIKRLKALIIQKDGQLDVYKYQTADYNPDRNKLSVSRPFFFTLLALLAAMGALATYAYFFRKPESRQVMNTYSDSTASANDTSQNLTAEMYADSLAGVDTAALLRSMPPIPEEEQNMRKDLENKSEKAKTEPVAKKPVTTKNKTKEQLPVVSLRTENDNKPTQYPVVNRQAKYTLSASKAYFYDSPDVRSRRPVFLSNSNESEFTATRDSNGFILVVFFNTDREITRGWLRKQDLRKIN